MAEENLISLKDAAQISGYSPDYIGQLIRSGKIPGKQIYTGITWMTTAEAVLAYKNKSKNSGSENASGGWLARQNRKLKIEYELLKLFFNTFKNSLPLLLFLVLILFIFVIYFGFLAMNKTTVFLEGQQPGKAVEKFTF